MVAIGTVILMRPSTSSDDAAAYTHPRKHHILLEELLLGTAGTVTVHQVVVTCPLGCCTPIYVSFAGVQC